MNCAVVKFDNVTGDRTEKFIEDAIAFAEHSTFVPTQFWLKWHRSLLDAQSPEATLHLWFLNWAYYRSTITAEFKAWEQSLLKRLHNVLSRSEQQGVVKCNN